MALATTLDDIPQTKSHNPEPGRFPDSTIHRPAVTEFTYVIELAWAEFTEIVVAAHAVVNTASGQESAWAAGNDFGGANWATYFTHRIQSCQGPQ